MYWTLLCYIIKEWTFLVDGNYFIFVKIHKSKHSRWCKKAFQNHQSVHYDKFNFIPEVVLQSCSPDYGLFLWWWHYIICVMSPECSIFYGCSFSRMLLFLVLAYHWPALACRWEQVERLLAHYGYPYHQHHKFSLITAIFLSVAFSEYQTFLFFLHKVYLPNTNDQF